MNRRLLAALIAAALALSACGQKTESGNDRGEAEPVLQIHPLTGVELSDGRPENPVFMVKVDNTRPAAPQYGLGKADLVVEQLVEGGMTRLAAMYYSKIPGQIGHVRSIRSTDVGLAAPVQARVIASGGSDRAISRLKDAEIPLHLEDYDVTGFSSDTSRGRPYNRMLDLREIAKKVGAASVEGDFFVFGEGLDGIKEPASEEAESAQQDPLLQSGTKVDVKFSRYTTSSFQFSDKRWQRTNGLQTVGADFKSKNLIVVRVKVADSGYHDPSGAFVPELKVEGSGDAWIAEGNHWIKATWHKEAIDSPMSFTSEDGQEVGIKPGKTWVELIPDTESDVTFR